jgi:branched-chain amino acid transport system permease protein
MKRADFLGAREPTKTGRTVKYSILGVILLLLATQPFWGSDYTKNIFILMFLYLSFAQMWNLLGGYSGLVSLGQQAFIGIGGYSIAMLTQVYKMPIILGVVTSVVVTIIFALIISLPLFKMRGVYFTIGTWIIAEALSIFFINWLFVNSGIGYNITVAYRMNLTYFYLFCFAIGIGSVPTTLHPSVMERFRRMFDIPDDVGFHFCVPLGYPKGNFGPTDRKPTSETTFLDRWGAAVPWA